MEMTKDVILARQLRLATISNLVGQGILDEPSAKELLSGALEPGNDSTIVDDSALLGDPEALVKIAAEQSVQPTPRRRARNPLSNALPCQKLSALRRAANANR